MVTQYDVEVYQRIEQLMGVKLPEWPVDPDALAILGERVQEAQRLALQEVKEHDKKHGKGKGKRRHDEHRA